MPLNKIVVIGGINMDISGTSYSALVERDSNPGMIAFSPGGVGRNIAENLARLGLEVELICALGGDEFAALHERYCNELNIGLNLAKHVPDGKSDIYLCINEPSGDMRLAVSDMDLSQNITAEHLNNCIDFINSCSICVADANLPAASIAFLTKNVSVPLFLDPVSAAKAVKAKELIGSFHTVKPNRMEAGVIVDCDASTDKGLCWAADTLLLKGVRRVFISLGAEGIFYADGSVQGVAPSVAGKVVNTTGAGDAAMAALVWGTLNGFSTDECAAAACRASAVTIECETTVNKRLCEELLKTRTYGDGSSVF